VVLVAVHVPVLRLYRPPVLRTLSLVSSPPQIIHSLPANTSVCESRAEGALAVLVAIQLSVPGLYLPPVSYLSGVSNRKKDGRCPPQMIISLPVQTAV
jgi:hypothetical protein